VSETSHRLPDHVRPHRYDLVLEPDLEAATFTGSVSIGVLVERPSREIVLHALDLQIHSASVIAIEDPAADPSTGTPTVDVVDMSTDDDDETVTLTLSEELAAGAARVELTFSGVLNDQLVGFYRSTFHTDADDDGDPIERVLAVTQFESTHARRAFPCFDEPALKAVFGVTLVVPDDQFVVANTAETSRRHEGDGRVRVQFADTIPMSTYLVAFVVGPLEATEPRMVAGTDGPIPLRVVHPPGTAHLCEFALDVAEAALQYFERYYELPYPGDKVDLVAVPDFAFGAMENLGCITFREVLLLVDPDRATQPELQRVADVINHELAHMWFGDLVTMSWWNGIWLNEAFATFMEVKASESFRPDWDVWTTFGLARAAAFDTDALHSTRPIEYEVVTAADAEGMFDILTYEKGASVVRMLEQYLGEERFRAGIAEYLQRHAYGTTETTDLWDALEAVTGEPVRRIMDSWIFRGGHPAVTVERTASGVRLDQSRASYLGATDGGSAEVDAAQRWPVPLVLRATAADGTSTHRVLLEDPLELDLLGYPSLVQANVAGNGFFRVVTDDELRVALASDPGATPLERFVLIDDTWAAFLADLVGLDAVVSVLDVLGAHETDPSVWKRLAGTARDVARLAGAEHRGAVSGWIDGLAGGALARIETAIDGADPDPRRLEVRGVLFSLAGTDGADASVRTEARQRVDDPATDPELRAASIAVIAASATPAEHADLERRWRAAETPQEELRYLHALVDGEDPELFDRAVDLAVTEVRSQNAPYLLRRAIDRPVLGARAWHTTSRRWDEVTDRFPSNSLPRMLEGIRGVTDPELADAIRTFLGQHPTPTGAQQVVQHVERMQVTVAAAQRARAELARAPGMLVHGPS
jgi:puromycin-sensitive aminopeptidase